VKDMRRTGVVEEKKQNWKKGVCCVQRRGIVTFVKISCTPQHTCMAHHGWTVGLVAGKHSFFFFFFFFVTGWQAFFCNKLHMLKIYILHLKHVY
jgi:hypothetical protein